MSKNQVEECSICRRSPPKIDLIWTVGRPGSLDNTDNALRQGLDNPPRTTRQKQEKPSSAGVDHCCFQYNVLNYVLEFPLNASKSTQTQKSRMANMFCSMSMPIWCRLRLKPLPPRLLLVLLGLPLNVSGSPLINKVTPL